MRMAGSALASHLVLWPFAPPVSALAVFDRGRGLAVLTYHNTKLRTGFRREQWIGGNFVIRDYCKTNLCGMHTQMRARSCFRWRYPCILPCSQAAVAQVGFLYEPNCFPLRILRVSKIEHSSLRTIDNIVFYQPH